jgi:hypothetical protein
MRRILIVTAAAGLLLPASGVAAQAPTPPAARDKAPWKALTNGVEAAEIVLRDVCLPGIAEGKDIAPLAEYEWLVAMPSKVVRAGPADRVWRIGSIRHVYAVAWADGSCSTYADGSAADLRQMAERTILARPEGFVRGSSGPVDGGRLERTVYCARVGDGRLVASVTTPLGKAKRRARSLSSTVYRAKGWSELCDPGPVV